MIVCAVGRILSIFVTPKPSFSLLLPSHCGIGGLLSVGIGLLLEVFSRFIVTLDEVCFEPRLARHASYSCL